MNILVLGAGAVGLPVAARLSKVANVYAVALHGFPAPCNQCITDLIRFREDQANRSREP